MGWLSTYKAWEAAVQPDVSYLGDVRVKDVEW